MAITRTPIVDDDGSGFSGTGLDNAWKQELYDQIDAANAAKAPLASPTFTGTPAAPTAAVGTNTTQLATTAFVQAAKAPRVASTASSATPTPNADTTDQYVLTALAAAAAFANPTGTPVEGQKLLVRIKDNGTARALTYGTQYRPLGVALPSTTVISKTLYLGLIYNATDTKWDLVAVSQEA